MTHWILLFALSSLVVSSQSTCPPKHFSAVFLHSIDQIVDNPVSLSRDDPELSFFREVMKFQEKEIQHIFDDAIHFFNYTFDLDFSTAMPNERNERVLDNAIMRTFALSDDTNYIATTNSWIRNGNTRSTCYRIRDGGFLVTLLSDQTLYGKYGGDEGKPAGPFEQFVYGFYSIDACEKSPVIIHYRCPIPIRAEPIDGALVVNCYAYNRVLGHGRIQGISIIKQAQDNSGKFHVNIKNIVTF